MVVAGCGQVFAEPMFPQARQKNVCSKNSGAMPSSSGSNSSKISCASYVP